jgi:hypothetical protein
MKFKDLKVWIFIFGMMLLVGAYLYQHSKTNQQQLDAQGIKAIYLAKNNFVEALYNYHTQLEGYLSRNFYKWTSGETNSPASQLVGLLDRAPKFVIEKIGYKPGSKKKLNPLANAEVELLKYDSSFFLQIKGFRYFLEEMNMEGNEVDKGLLDSISKNWQLDISKDPADVKKGHFEIDHTVSIYHLLENNIQSFFFDDLFVLDGSGRVMYPGHSAGLPLLSADDLDDPNSFGESSLDLKIAEKDYKGFISPAFIGDKTLYLLGIKESAQFDRVALRINFNLLSTFLTVLLLVFVSIPIISIFNLSDGDILTKGRIYGLGLSLIVVMVVLGFSFFSLLQNYRTFGSSEEDIEGLKGIFNNEIMALKTDLDQYGNTENDEPGSFGGQNGKVNEFLEFDRDGRIISMAIPDELGKLDTINFQDFPFISISERDYVKALPKADSSYFISAHFSKSTGNLEGVISKRLGENGKAVTFGLDQMAPMISRNQRYFIFKSDGKVLLKSEKVNIPINYLQEGVGQDRWDEIQTLIKNNSGSPIQRVWEIPIYVNGHEYEALLSFIPYTFLDEGIWLLYLEDKNLQHALHSLASLEAIAVFIPYLFVLVLLSVFTLMAKKSSIYLAFEPFSFHWYSPSPQKRNRFLWLNYILAFDILLYLFVYLVIPLCIFKIYIWAALFAIQAGTCNFLMLYAKGSGYFRNNINNFLIIVLVLWLGFAAFLVYFSISSVPFPYLVLTILVLIFMLGLKILCFYLSNINRLPSLVPEVLAKNRLLNAWHGRLTIFWNKLTQVQVDKRVYAMNFLLWLMIIGFLPGYFIHRQIFNQEKFIWDNTNNFSDQECDLLKPDSGLYFELIMAHEKFRRTNFGLFTNQEDEKVKTLIAPPRKLFISSFCLPSNLELFSRAGSQSLGFGDALKKNLLVWIVLLVILIWLFNMIMRLSNKIYLIDYHFAYEENKLPKMTKMQKSSFVIGLDAEKSKSWIMDQFGMAHGEILPIEVKLGKVKMPELMPSHKAVILENIHCMENVDALLETMLAFREKYHNERVLLFVSSGRPLPELIKTNISKQQKLLITEIFSGFLFQFVSLEYQNPRLSLPYLDKEWENLDQLEQIAHKEKIESVLFNDEKISELVDDFSYGPNAISTAAMITQDVARDPLDQPLSQERFEKCILTLQRFNKAYYMNIWAELSIKERKMVYNYAKEGFINFFNKETMTALVQKGVLKINSDNDGLVLFSKSFRNFVCLFVSEEELSLFKQDERKSGNAKMIQAAAFSFVFISIGLISFYDPNILNETSAYISGFIGLAGTIYSLIVKGLGKKIDLES